METFFDIQNPQPAFLNKQINSLGQARHGLFYCILLPLLSSPPSFSFSLSLFFCVFLFLSSYYDFFSYGSFCNCFFIFYFFIFWLWFIGLFPFQDIYLDIYTLPLITIVSYLWYSLEDCALFFVLCVLFLFLSRANCFAG